MNDDIMDERERERVPRKYLWQSTLKLKRLERLKKKGILGKRNREKELNIRRKTRKSRSPSPSLSLSPPTEKKPYPMGKTADFKPLPPPQRGPHQKGFLLGLMEKVKSKARNITTSPSKNRPYKNELLTSVLGVELKKPSQKRKSLSPPSPTEMTGKDLIENQMSKRRGFMQDESDSASASPFSSAENSFGSLVSVKKASPKRAKTPPKTRKVFKPKPAPKGPQPSLEKLLQLTKGNLKSTIRIKEPIVGENPPAFTFNKSMLNLVKDKEMENSPNSFDSFGSK